MHSRWAKSIFVAAMGWLPSFFPFQGPAHAQENNVTQPSSLDRTREITDERLSRLFNDYHEEYLILFPMEATMFGDYRYNNLLPIDISPEFLAKERAFYERTLRRLSEIDSSKASDTLNLSADVLRYELGMRLEGMDLHPERIPCHQFEGLPLTIAQNGAGTGNHPFKSVKDYDDWLQRLDAFATWVDEAIEQFSIGAKENFVLPGVLVNRMVEQCSDPTIVTKTPEESLFYEPIRSMPNGFSDQDRARLKSAYSRMIEQRVIPAYRKLGIFLQKDYLPKTRATSGVNALPDGKRHYEYWVRYWTTTKLTPDEIHAIGLQEVTRIRGEMEKVKSALGFQGELKDFFQHIRTDKSFTPFDSPEEVLNAFRSIQSKIEPHIPSMFIATPKTPFEIRRTEAFREKTASAEYMPGTEDGTRPGVFYVPIPDAKSFNVTSGMESLFLHEAIPGHHFQISLQQENQQLPKFARFLWYGAYGEGWALYCESLGKELGLYEDPKQYMGALGDEMHRAIRLVVDVGMHWKNMTREEAIEYSMANEPISYEAAVAEIERYMAVPGQALSYKIGSLEIQKLRRRYQSELGDRFSLADFHHQILKDGGMPLSLLESRLDKWAESQRPASK